MSNLSEGCMFLVDKPLEWTSFDVVRYMKKFLGLKLGHAGTLDPLATGLLIVCGGRWTKHIEGFQQLPKTYSGTIVFGATTPSFDRESEEENFVGVKGWESESLNAMAASLTGLLTQLPPVYSAKKINGKKACDLTRSGKPPEMRTQQIEVTNFTLQNFREENDRLFVDFQVVCSKGTYIRSLANDLGAKSGFGAYLHSLRREKIGSFEVSRALSVQDIREIFPKPAKADINAENQGTPVA